MPSRPSSLAAGLTFHLKSWISLKRPDNFCVCVLMYCKNMDLVESSKRSYLKVRKVKFGLFVTWRQFSQKRFVFSLFWHQASHQGGWVLMDCQTMDLIESL